MVEPPFKSHNIMTDQTFDPNGVGIDNGSYFGMPYAAERSKLVLVSVPWDVTTSYGGGTSMAPDAIIHASLQVDLYDAFFPDTWQQGIATDDIDFSIVRTNRILRKQALKVISHLQSGGSQEDPYASRRLEKINAASEELNQKVYDQTKRHLDAGRLVGIVGGDHSVPFGAIKAIAEKYDDFGILHIDAHADLRQAYEGFDYSHASIMYNVLDQVPNLSKLVSVAIRDYCDQEAEICSSDPRVTMFDDMSIQAALFSGQHWASICDKIIASLPENIYISFDIDGLTPDNCPNTGTPVPGGLTYNQAVYLIQHLAISGKRIIGFDLNEVCPSPEHKSEWDANVGARLLYKLCGATLRSQEK